MAIERLNQGTITAASQLPFGDVSNGVDRRASVNSLATLIATLIASPGVMVTQYEAPSATGFSIAVSPPTLGASVFLIVTAGGGYATGTITLPAVATLADGQELLVANTESVGALTVNGAGAAVAGAPGALSANDYFRLRYDAVHVTWYRVG